MKCLNAKYDQKVSSLNLGMQALNLSPINTWSPEANKDKI